LTPNPYSDDRPINSRSKANSRQEANEISQPQHNFVENVKINKKQKDSTSSNTTNVDLGDKCIYLYYCKGKMKGCKAAGDVWGSNPYTCDTDLCRVGIHANQINENGGLYIIAYGGAYINFLPSQKNGILSNAWDSHDIHFLVANKNNADFDLESISFNKCGFYIGKCRGKSNGCCYGGVVFGTNPYHHDSNLCNSALHSGIINEKGGSFLIQSSGPLNRFNGSTSNGITSEKTTYDGNPFLIKQYN